MGTIFRMFKNFISVNPTLKESSFKVSEFRQPPGSFPQEYEAPSGPADKLSKNYYYTRDVRRNYPRTIVYTQDDLSLLLTAPSVDKIEAPADATGSAVEAAKEIPIPSLNEAISTLQAPSQTSFEHYLPPIPNKRYRYAISDENYAKVPGHYWPIYLVK